MKTMCPPGYHHNGFVATHALALCVSWITYDHLYILYIYIYICIYMANWLLSFFLHILKCKVF